MNISDAIKSIIRPHEEDTLAPLSTVWGEHLDPDYVLPEYPRPQLRRDSFISLNGYWDYAITSDEQFPSAFDGKILVPFSPECTLSGVNRQLQPSEYLWYRRLLPPLRAASSASAAVDAVCTESGDMRTILHFGAVDYSAEVYINGSLVCSHVDGYLPFSVDITAFLVENNTVYAQQNISSQCGAMNLALQNPSAQSIEQNAPQAVSPQADTQYSIHSPSLPCNELLLKVQDPTDCGSQSRGKQTLHRGGIFYTAQSGIWQSVWLEQVPAAHIEKLWFETDYDSRQVTARITVTPKGSPVYPETSLTVFSGNTEILRKSRLECVPMSSPDASDPTVFSTDTSGTNASNPDSSDSGPSASGSSDSGLSGTGFSMQSGRGRKPLPSHRSFSISFTIPETFFRSWSPEDPFLYSVRITYGSDRAESYFALRCYTIEKNTERPDSAPVFCLNHRPYFLMGVLDQGYWPESLYTAPSDEALIYDITAMKAMGFNMLRKHIKVESARWYYHCDRLGMIVCQDMVNGGSRYQMPLINYLPTLFPRFSLHIKDSCYPLFSRKDARARRIWKRECARTLEHLRFFPSIAIWVPFNEGWGQFDSARVTAFIRKKDPSRLIDSASGWFDQGCGDFISVHNYFRPLTVPVKKWGRRAFFLSEYGGLACHIQDHSSTERIFGYKRYDSLEEFRKSCLELTEKSLLPLQEQGLSGAVYTQLSDVEEEVNGLLTYDRKINKLSGGRVMPDLHSPRQATGHQACNGTEQRNL